jgi:ribosomal protein S18 acetylase RimI-like enzyme
MRTQHDVRIATVADVPSLAPLLDAYRQFYEQVSDLDHANRYLHERLSRNESLVFLAFAEDGNPSGFCQLYPTFCTVVLQPILVLYDLYVSPHARKAGLANALMQVAEDHARATGAARLDLTTARNNFSAQSLYRARGWQEDTVFLTFSKPLK